MAYTDWVWAYVAVFALVPPPGSTSRSLDSGQFLT